MRNLKWLLVGLFVAGAAAQSSAQAQTAAAAPAERYFFNLSFGGQSREQTFTTGSTFTIYGEQGAVASGHSIGGGTLFDLAAGAQVWRNLAIGLAYSTVSNENDATALVRVPHPAIFGRSREASATAADLEHSENAVHLQFRWMVPITDKIQVDLFAGPSFFTVRQDIATVRAPQDIADPAPFTSVSITSVTITEVKDSPVGFNVGIDATYAITQRYGVAIGVGGFLRYSQASIDLPAPQGVTLDAGDLKAGGGQGALGLRLRF